MPKPVQNSSGSTSEQPTNGDRRAELLSVAGRLFGERGYDATSTQDIADEMKIRKASVYHYVKTKEDLLWMVVEPPLRQLVANAEEILAPDSEAPAMKKLADAMEAHARSFEEHYPHMFVITQEHGKSLSAARRKEFDALREGYTELWISAIEAGVKSGELRADLDARLTVYAILGMLNWMFRWFTPGRRYTSDQIAHSFAGLLDMGLTA